MKKIIRNVVVCLLLCSLCACQEQGKIKEKTNGNTVNTEKTEKIEKTEKKSAGIVKETLESYLKNKECQIIYPVKDTVIACKRVLKDRTVLDFMDLDTGEILATLEKEFFCNTLSVEMCGDVCVIQEVKEMGETEDVPVLLLNDKYEEIDTMWLPYEIYKNAFCVLPDTSKILYAGYSEDAYKTCVMEYHVATKKTEERIKFDDPMDLDGFLEMKVSDDGKFLYFRGTQAPNRERNGVSQYCYGAIALKSGKLEKEQGEKQSLVVRGKDAYFCDEGQEDADGIIFMFSEGRKKKTFSLKPNADEQVSFSGGYVWSLQLQMRQKEEQDKYTLDVYHADTMKKEYVNENVPCSTVVISEKQQKIYLFYYDYEDGYMHVDIEEL